MLECYFMIFDRFFKDLSNNALENFYYLFYENFYPMKDLQDQPRDSYGNGKSRPKLINKSIFNSFLRDSGLVSHVTID